MRNDPCFSCSLPDCDETDRRCAVRMHAANYQFKRRRGQLDSATDLERECAARLHSFWTTERKAEASEGGRAFHRGGRTWSSEGVSR